MHKHLFHERWSRTRDKYSKARINKTFSSHFKQPYNTDRVTGKQCSWIAIRLPALLVEGIPQAPMNAEFHSAAARPLDAFIRLRIAPNMTFEGSVPLTAKKNREANLLPAFLAGFSLFFSPLDPTGKQTLTGKEIVSGCDDGTF